MKARKICIVGDIAMVPLTKGEYAYVDAEKYDIVAGKNWHLVSTKGKLYAATIIPTPENRLAKTYLHRIVLGATAGEEVDHINNNGLDNRSDNLRIVSSFQNHQNRAKQKNNTSGAPCVFWSKKAKKWLGEIQFNGEKISLGLFDSVESAFEAVAKRKSLLYREIEMPH